MVIAFIPIWKEAPFIRLLIPFIGGIIMQWYFEWSFILHWSMIPGCMFFTFLFAFLKTFTKYRYYWVAGIFINLTFFSSGALLTHYADHRHQPMRISDLLQHNNGMIVTLEEPLSEKAHSFKANAAVDYIIKTDSLISSDEHIIVYFEKDPRLKELHFNTRIAFSKSLMAISHSGNPGAFDYQHYCALQGISYRAYLTKNSYRILPPGKDKLFRRYLFSSREKIVNIIRKYIRGEKEAGLAEALLIGYKDDLDKGLVQSYSNTGVVHIIAISGLHLALIYGILNVLFYPLGKRRGMRWFRAILVIGGLWIFGFLAGGSASVLRSALMFTFIVTGENIGRKSGIYNSLAASAFLLLCYNPLWLWDAGFELSYMAVLSIVIFMKRIYHCFFIQNKLLDLVWKMAAMSISAQLLTTPLSIYLFHQFPNYFLITNLVAVPLSSLILVAELVLCAGSWLPVAADAVGWISYALINLMNRFVEHVNTLPFSTWSQLQISVLQVLIVYIIITATAYYLFFQNRAALKVALIFLACLSITISFAIVQTRNQRLLIVYNVPHHQAIELVYSNKFYFVGDREMNENIPMQDFYLKPSHGLYRVTTSSDSHVNIEGNSVYFCGNRILIIDKLVPPTAGSLRCSVDICILSGSAAINVEQLFQTVDCRLLIFDSSNPLWKTKKLERDCKRLGIPCYSVAGEGAFILNMN